MNALKSITQTILTSIAQAIVNGTEKDKRPDYLRYGRVIRASAGTGVTACVIETSHGSWAVEVRPLQEGTA